MSQGTIFQDKRSDDHQTGASVNHGSGLLFHCLEIGNLRKSQQTRPEESSDAEDEKHDHPFRQRPATEGVPVRKNPTLSDSGINDGSDQSAQHTSAHESECG